MLAPLRTKALPSTVFSQRKHLAVTALNEKRREKLEIASPSLYIRFRFRKSEARKEKDPTNFLLSLRSHFALEWRTKHTCSRVFETSTKAGSKEFSKCSLGHPLLEAKCDEILFSREKRKSLSKHPHLRWILVLQQNCFWSSHWQKCSPHSSLRESQKFPDFKKNLHCCLGATKDNLQVMTQSHTVRRATLREEVTRKTEAVSVHLGRILKCLRRLNTYVSVANHELARVIGF